MPRARFKVIVTTFVQRRSASKSPDRAACQARAAGNQQDTRVESLVVGATNYLIAIVTSGVMDDCRSLAPQRIGSMIDAFGHNVANSTNCARSGWLPKLLLLAAPALCVGCGVRLGGMSANEAFAADPRVAAMVNAACEGDVKTVERLTKQGADPNFRGVQGAPPLFWVISSHKLAGVEKLLQLGADPNIRVPSRLTNYEGPDGDPIVNIVAAGEGTALLKLLLKYKGDPNSVYRGESALVNAVKSRRVEQIDTLLAAGADINFSDGPQSAFFQAAAIGRFDIALHLLDRGYRHDLKMAGKVAARRVVDQSSEQWQWKLKVLERLRRLGAEPPEPIEYAPLPPNPDEVFKN
jgi:hypothetical protein